MKNRNDNQSKHIANSLRIIGMAQFAAFGYPSLIKGNFYEVLFFMTMYTIAEIAAYKVLKTTKE
ncbi:MAG: hypothetical protein HFP77_10050 [Methylococcales symbiont of Iophon sp. n. MRB-2018]|nr:MAG: hypothetical protein HFP77_10050 [Methylococcales symbiont of Iophon sp. n. MRB-2018]KAF3979058.1 MAG: hypothetical protein HFP76_09020 [Methylococcales symbiont of Iophon sp. n. MRB-2018]